MKNLIKSKFITACIFVLIVITTISIYIFIKKNQREGVIVNLKGTVLCDNVNNSKMRLLNLETNNSIDLCVYVYKSPHFSNDSKKILYINNDNNIQIMEYYLETNSVRSIYKKDNTIRVINQVRYMSDNTSKILAQLDDKIYLIEDENNMTFLFEADNGFVCLDNENLFFSRDGKIYQGNISSKKETYIADGYSPEISNGKDYLVFLSKHNMKTQNVLIFYNLVENKIDIQYKLGKGAVRCYKFSPDDNYIAYTQGGIRDIVYYNFELRVLDFHNKRSFSVIDRFGGYDFDWE